MALMVILESLQQSAISAKNKMVDAKIVEQFLMVYEIWWTDWPMRRWEMFPAYVSIDTETFYSQHLSLNLGLVEMIFLCCLKFGYQPTIEYTHTHAPTTHTHTHARTTDTPATHHHNYNLTTLN